MELEALTEPFNPTNLEEMDGQHLLPSTVWIAWSALDYCWYVLVLSW